MAISISQCAWHIHRVESVLENDFQVLSVDLAAPANDFRNFRVRVGVDAQIQSTKSIEVAAMPAKTQFFQFLCTLQNPQQIVIEQDAIEFQI